jgi:hypothetical protein
MNAALQELLPAIATRPDEDQEALAEAAREIEALRDRLGYIVAG